MSDVEVDDPNADGVLIYGVATSLRDCLMALEKLNKPTYFLSSPTGILCNATWDTVLCWPATAAGRSAQMRCPPLKGLDTTKFLSKRCLWSGQWMGEKEGLPDPSKPAGWTNFSHCFTKEVRDMLAALGDKKNIEIAQDIARSARKLEFVGLGLSLISLLLCILIFSCFRRLRQFRNLLHLQLIVAILVVVVIRLVIYIDLAIYDPLHTVQTLPVGKTLNTMRGVCELAYLTLEYFKSAAFTWMFLEGWYLHNTLVFNVFGDEPKIYYYAVVAYALPVTNTVMWIAAMFVNQGELKHCLDSYYMKKEFWILEGPRMAQLVINSFFICNVIRVLWTKVRSPYTIAATVEIEKMKKSVKAALMLIPLLGIPNILQTIPLPPSKNNITYFAVFTYCASFTYQFQGFMIALLYCFTNKEVIETIKLSWDRHRLRHSAAAGRPLLWSRRRRHPQQQRQQHHTRVNLNSPAAPLSASPTARTDFFPN